MSRRRRRQLASAQATDANAARIRSASSRSAQGTPHPRTARAPPSQAAPRTPKSIPPPNRDRRMRRVSARRQRLTMHRKYRGCSSADAGSRDHACGSCHRTRQATPRSTRDLSFTENPRAGSTARRGNRAGPGRRLRARPGQRIARLVAIADVHRRPTSRRPSSPASSPGSRLSITVDACRVHGVRGVVGGRPPPPHTRRSQYDPHDVSRGFRVPR